MAAAVARLLRLRIEALKVVVVGELFAGFDRTQCEHTHALQSVDGPLLKFTVRRTRVVRETRDAAHAVGIDDEILR